MTVKSADKKPEKYVGPDGKPKIRMVSVDKEVVKNEAYDEPQGQAKRIASPLQKARMDKEKADRDREGKLKSEGKTFKDFIEAYSMKEMVCKSCGDTYGKPTNENCMYDAYDMNGENWCSRKEYMAAQKKNEAMTPVGQRDKMKIIDRKPHPDGGHIVTMQTKAGKTIKRHLKNGKVKDMKESVKKGTHISDDPKAQERIEKLFKGLKNQPKGKDMKDMFGFMMKQMGYNPKTGLKEAVSKLPGGNKHLATAGTKATIMHPVTRVSKKVDKKDLKKHVDAGWKHMGQKRNRVEDTDEGYASDAQRKAVWASKNEKDKKESVEQVDELSKKTVQSYWDKTKGDDAFSGTRKANNRLKGAIQAVGKLKKKESVDEVLDTPKAMQSYKDKAKYSRDRASGSAAAKILSKGTLGSHKPELDTMRKRHKGMDMVDRNAKKKTFAALRGKK